MLKLRIAPWRGTNSVEMSLPNPAFTEPAHWTGAALPQSLSRGNHQIMFKALETATNEPSYFRTALPYWKPVFEIHSHGGKLEDGWDLDWTAEDRYGNRGQQLGLNEPVLKFSASFHPRATNPDAAVLVKTFSAIDPSLQTDVWWNATVPVTSNNVTILGVFPRGIRWFEGGKYVTNPPIKLGPTMGGAPSGWVGTSRRETPTRTRSFHCHYSDVPVIYVRVPDLKSKQRIGFRFVDEQHRVFAAEMEPEGGVDGIIPFLIKAPANSGRITPELVFLPEIEGEFFVNLPKMEKLNTRKAGQKPGGPSN